MDIFSTKTKSAMARKVLDGSDPDLETRSTMSSAELLDSPGYSSQFRAEPTPLVVARLISRTLLTITFVVSILVLFTVYMQNRAVKCDYGIQSHQSSHFEPLVAESSGQPAESSGPSFPISLKMSGKAGEIFSATPNLGVDRGHVNCVIERKSANQIIASEPKQLTTPFGNMTTDPRLIQLNGEKLIFDCRSGDEADERDNKEKEVIVIAAGRDDEGEQFDDRNQPQSQQSSDAEHRDEHSDDDNNRLNEQPLPTETKNRSKRSLSTESKQLQCSCSC